MKRKIVVLGGGISGYGSAILAKKKGFDTFLTDIMHLCFWFSRNVISLLPMKIFLNMWKIFPQQNKVILSVPVKCCFPE